MDEMSHQASQDQSVVGGMLGILACTSSVLIYIISVLKFYEAWICKCKGACSGCNCKYFKILNTSYYQAKKLNGLKS